MTPTTNDQTIARLRRTLLLLANNQSQRQQIEAAGRHLVALHEAMRQRDEQREERKSDG